MTPSTEHIGSRGRSTARRLAGGLIQAGAGLFAAGLAVGLGLILHFFYATRFGLCSASLSTMTVTEAWPWALPLLAVEAIAFGLGAAGFGALALERTRAAQVAARQQGGN